MTDKEKEELRCNVLILVTTRSEREALEIANPLALTPALSRKRERGNSSNAGERAHRRARLRNHDFREVESKPASVAS